MSGGAGLFERTREGLRRAVRGVTQAARAAWGGGFDPALPEADRDRLERRIAECLAGRGGEVSARQRAAELAAIYGGLGAEGRERFFDLLARRFGPDRAAIDAAIASRARAEDDASRARAEDGLRAALTPPRLGLFRQFAAAPAGVKSVVDLRADLARLVRRHPDWAAMENEVLGLLASWFDIGLLELRRMTWEAPAALLEKLIRYEAVHAIRSWDDLKNRLDSDRRCYAYFHPRMPDEPLIFVEVALVKGMADDVQALLDEAAPAADPRQADAAIFYSISNCQRGLAGVGFGEFLIKRVVDDLKRDFPRLDLFATLSPLPGFRAFAEPLLTEEDRAELARPEWIAEAAPVERLRPRLMGLAARYLLEAGPEGRARDRVAHFHLTNGARIERINFLADRSAHGLAQSYGVMVNYRYKLDDIAANHEAYRGEGRIGATGAVRALFKG